MSLLIDLVYFFLFLLISITCNSSSVLDCDPLVFYPPIDQPGPSYTVPRANLSDHLKCYPGRKHNKRWILFLPGCTEEVNELYGWNWMPLMDKKGWPYCTLQLPDRGMHDLQVAAEYVVYTIRKIYKHALKEKENGIRRNIKISIIGHSLGGTLPRFALRFWPDVRPMVRHLIALAPPNHGTLMADTACRLTPCAVSVAQQRTASSFLCALNSHQQTFPPIIYVNILSKSDEIIRPLNSSEINEQGVTNIYIQDLCPFRILTEHLALGTYDYCAYLLTMTTLRSRSLKNVTAETCCAQSLMPGINASTAEFLSHVAHSAAEHARRLLVYSGEVREEPELRCPFRTDCLVKKRRVKRTRRR